MRSCPRPHLPRPPRHHARRPGGGGGHAAVPHREVRQPLEPAARLRTGGARRRRGGARARGRARSAREPEDIVFTSGATESNNLAVRGVAAGRGRAGRHVVTTAIEHPAVLEPCRTLEREGFEVTRRGRRRGRDRLRRRRSSAPCARTPSLVSVMAANNEIGTLAAGGGDRTPLPRRAASCSTPTPCRRSAASPSTSRTGARIS